jgi:hypothetical protein
MDCRRDTGVEWALAIGLGPQRRSKAPRGMRAEPGQANALQIPVHWPELTCRS